MATAARIKKGALTISIKGTRNFSRIMGTNVVNASTTKKKTSAYSTAANNDQDSAGRAIEPYKSRHVPTASEDWITRSFVKGQWRRTDTRGLIQGVGSKEREYSTGSEDDTTTPRVNVNKNWQVTNTFGVMAADADPTTDGSKNKNVEPGKELAVDDINGPLYGETAVEKPAADGLEDKGDLKKSSDYKAPRDADEINAKNSKPGKKTGEVKGDWKSKALQLLDDPPRLLGKASKAKGASSESGKVSMVKEAKGMAVQWEGALDVLAEVLTPKKEEAAEGEYVEWSWGYGSYPYTRLF